MKFYFPRLEPGNAMIEAPPLLLTGCRATTNYEYRWCVRGAYAPYFGFIFNSPWVGLNKNVRMNKPDVTNTMAGPEGRL